MKERIEFLGREEHIKKHGADYLRKLVLWLNDRPEYLNDNKSRLDLIKEYNIERRIK